MRRSLPAGHPRRGADVARLLAETALLNERLKALASDADPALLADAMRDLREIRAACLRALGRSP